MQVVTTFLIFSLLLSDLSERLNLSKDEGEKWIVNLIRETRMGADAKIDLEKVSASLFSSLLLILTPSGTIIECDRDPSPASPYLSIRHRKDPWARVPHAGYGSGHGETAAEWRPTGREQAGCSRRSPVRKCSSFIGQIPVAYSVFIVSLHIKHGYWSSTRADICGTYCNVIV